MIRIIVTIICLFFFICIMFPMLIVEYILQHNYHKFETLISKLWINAYDNKEHNKCDEYKDLYLKGAIRFFENKNSIDDINWFKNKCKELENEIKHDI